MRTLILAFIAAWATGCVTLGTHEALIKEHNETKERLAQAQLELAAREHELDVSKKHGSDVEGSLAAVSKKAADDEAALSSQVSAKEAQLKELQAQLDKENADMAQALKDKSALKTSVDQMRQALDELAKRKAEADRRVAELSALKSRFKSLIDAGKLKVKIVDGRMVVALASDVLFAPGSAALSKDGHGDYRNDSNLQPQAATDARLMQGMVEGSNVQPVIQISRLIEVSRAYESIAQMMDQTAQLSSQAIDRLARVS